MFDRAKFEIEKRQKAQTMAADQILRKMALDLVTRAERYDYAYPWTWFGLPIIQLPADIMTLQEIILEEKPDVIIETGVAWGGSVAFSASLLQLLGKGKVVAVDLNLAEHVAEQLMALPFAQRIHLYRGSSTDASVASKIKGHVERERSVMVMLDSNHTHDHVLDELRLYAPLVTRGQFLVVSDTSIEDMPAPEHRQRSWGPGNNPMSALSAYLKENGDFEIDKVMNDKVLTSFCSRGYLRRVR